MGLRFIKRTWLLKDVGSDYSDDNDEIPEVLQTDHELEEANIVGDEPIPEEIDITTHIQTLRHKCKEDDKNNLFESNITG